MKNEFFVRKSVERFINVSIEDTTSQHKNVIGKKEGHNFVARRMAVSMAFE